MVRMAVVGVLCVLLATGVALTLRWGREEYQPWDLPEPGGSASEAPPLRAVVVRYLRGVAIVLVAGFWAGTLVTGPAVRLAMRLLAVTSGDEAQGRLTEADEVVGRIDLEGTIGLLVFGGILPGLLSAALYVVLRRLLPSGRLAGVVFGVLHLVVGATRVDPLRPENPDFGFLGPGWLAVLVFGATAVVHGMAVVAIANRYSASTMPRQLDGAGRWRAVLPLVLPVLLLVPGAPALVPIAIGLALVVVSYRSTALVRAIGSPRLRTLGRAAIVVATVALLPGTLLGLRDVVAGDRRIPSAHGDMVSPP